MDIFKKIIHDLHERRAAVDSKQLPTPSCVREASATEKKAVYQPPNYGLLFCPHARSYFEPCSNCKRTKKQAAEHFYLFEKRHGL